MDLPSEDSLRWIVSRYASLRAEHGEGIGDPVLVQPTADHFPDAFELSVEGVGRFLARMLEYAPVAGDLDVRLRVIEEEDDGSCGTGSCGGSGARGGAGGGGKGSGGCEAPGRKVFGDRVIDTDDGYIVLLPTSAVGHPSRLAAALARSVGTIVLWEAGEGEGVDDDEIGPMSELAASAVGLGVLLLGGAYLFGKSCGGVRIEQSTHLDVTELAVAVALFTRLHDGKPSRAKEHLETTQREAFGEAMAWVDSNSDLLADLEERPEVLADGVFRMREVKGLLGRWLSGSRQENAAIEAAPPPHHPVRAQRTQRTPEDQKRLDEARELVDAALRG